jgi:hypothetical protein
MQHNRQHRAEVANHLLFYLEFHHVEHGANGDRKLNLLITFFQDLCIKVNEQPDWNFLTSILKASVIYVFSVVQ